MARFVASVQFDIEAFLLESNFIEFFQFAEVVGDDTRVTFTDRYDGITERLTMTGTFGDYIDGTPTSGTIATARYSITGGELFTFTGLAMTVEEFTGYVQNNDMLGLFTSLFAGNDTIQGSTSDDVLYGFAGDDVIDGRLGADRMVGMTGDDRYIVNNVGDIVTEFDGEGVDSVTARIDYTLPDHVENLRLANLAVQGAGNALDNTIVGTDTENRLLGAGGADVLLGRGGRDELLGGGGNDIIDGGLGKDTLTGNGGADGFKFRDGDTASGRFSADLITDFSQIEGDEILLSLIDADTTLDGNQRFAWVADGAFTGVAGQLRYVQAGGMTYVEGDTDGDMVADMVIALNGTIDLTAADFTF